MHLHNTDPGRWWVTHVSWHWLTDLYGQVVKPEPIGAEWLFWFLVIMVFLRANCIIMGPVTCLIGIVETLPLGVQCVSNLRLVALETWNWIKKRHLRTPRLLSIRISPWIHKFHNRIEHAHSEYPSWWRTIIGCPWTSVICVLNGSYAYYKPKHQWQMFVIY